MSLLDLTTDDELLAGLYANEPSDVGEGAGGPVGPQPENTGPVVTGPVRQVDWGAHPNPSQSQNGTLLDRTSDEELLGGAVSAPTGGPTLLDRTPDAELLRGIGGGELPVVAGIAPLSQVQPSGLEAAIESPVGKGIQAGVLGSTPALVGRLAGLPINAPNVVEGVLPQLAQQLTTLGIDIPTLWTPAGRVARLGIERAVATLAERMGPEAAAKLIFSRIGEAAQTAATSGLTFSAADATKTALEEAQKPTATVGGVLGAAAGAAGRGAVTGTAVGVAAQVPQPVLRFLAELGAMTGVPAAMEGRTPTGDELLQSGVTLGALKLGYRLAGLDFPAARRMSESEVTAEEQRVLESLPSDRLRDLRQTASPQSPRYADFLTRIDAILAQRGEGPPAPPAQLETPAAPPPAPRPEVPPTAPPEAGPPPAGAPTAAAPSAPPVTGPAALTPEEQTQVDAGRPYVLHDDQGRWWAVSPTTNVTRGPFDFPEEAEAEMQRLAQAPPSAPAPPAPAPEPVPEVAPTPTPVVEPTPAPEEPAGPPPEDLDHQLRGMIVAINEGQPGSRQFDPDTGAFVQAIPTTYPQWMTEIGKDKNTAIASIQSALTGRRGPGAARAIEIAGRLIQQQAERYPEPGPSVPAAPTEPEAAPFEPQTGERAQTPEGPGTVAELGPFGEAYVDLDDDGQKTFMLSELGPTGPPPPGAAPAVAAEPPPEPSPLPEPSPRVPRGRALLPAGPAAPLQLPAAPAPRQLRAAPQPRLLPAGPQPKLLPPAPAEALAPPAPPLRFEQTAAGPQAIIPGTDIPQVTGGRIRGRPSGPAITSADAAANLFNQEAVARRTELEQAQGELPTAPPAATPRAPRGRPAPARQAHPESRYAGEDLDALLSGAQDEQLDRWTSMQEARARLEDPKLTPKKRKAIEGHIASTGRVYEAAYSEVADAAGQSAADAMRARIEAAAPAAPGAAPPPAPSKPIWEMTKEEYDNFIAKGGVAERPVSGAPSAMTPEDVQALRRSIAVAPQITNTPYRLYDTAQSMPAAVTTLLSRDRLLADLARALDAAHDDIAAEIVRATGTPHEEQFGSYTFGGIGLGDSYFGLNVDQGLAFPRDVPNLLLVNPYTTIEGIPAGTEDLPRLVAQELVATAVHELAHQTERAHGDPFDQLVGQYEDLARAAMNQHIIRLAEFLTQDHPETGGTVLDHFARTLAQSIKPFWHQGRDLYRDAGASADRPAEREPARGREGAPPEGAGGGARPGGVVRGRGEAAPGAVEPGAAVRGGGALAESPHKAAIRAALQSGALTPERAEQLGHFTTYPDLRALVPPTAPTPGAPLAAPGPRPRLPSAARGPPRTKLGALVQGYLGRIQRGVPPGSPQALREAADNILGQKAAKDPLLQAAIYDAWEAAVNLHARNEIQDAESFPARMELARKAERLLTGRAEPQPTQRYATPLPLAVAAAHALDVQPGETLVEAGVGNPGPWPSQNAVLVNEMDPRRAAVLADLGRTPAIADALYTPFRGSAVLLSPPWGPYTAAEYGPPIPMPYADARDVAERFVVKALRELPDGGRLSTILPAHVLQNQEFMRWVTGANTLRGLIHSPPDAYASRTTRVDSVLLVVDKGRIPDVPQPVRSTPATWDEYDAAVARLGAGGEHGRVGFAAPAVDLTRSADALDTARPGGAWTPQGEAGQAEAPAGSPRREPDDVEAPGPVPRAAGGAGGAARGGRAPRGRAADVGPGLVPGGRADPETASERVRGDVASSTPPRVSPEPNGITLDGQRYGYRDEGEFRAALDSRIFAPAPLRSGTGQHPHLRLVVKARSLLGAPLPTLQYQPSSTFLAGAYRDGRVSDQQWDYGIVPALQANSRGYGYLAAADVGVGKTRIGAGVVGEWLETGAATRILYVTKNNQNVGDVLKEFNLTSPGDQFPFRVIQVREHPEASARRTVAAGQPRPGLPTADRVVYLVDKYNLAAYSDALSKVGLDALVGDEVHEYKNATTDVGEAWLGLQRQVLAVNGKFLYLTATPATEFDDLRSMIGLREWTYENFGDYKARVVGLSGRTEQPKAIRDRVERTLYDYAWRKGIPEAQWPGTSDPLIREWLGLTRRGGPALPLLVDRLLSLEGKLLDAVDELPMPEGQTAPPAPPGAPVKTAATRDPFRSLISPAEMEQVVRELAMKGKYDAVDLWRAGTEFSVVDTPMAPEQVREYSQLAAFMRRIHDAFVTFGAKGQSAMFGPWTFFQGEAKARIADYRMDRALDMAQEALKNGEQVIFSILRVSEGHPERGWIPAAIRLVNETVKVKDPATGTMVETPIPEAIRAKEALRADWAKMRQTRSPVELIRQRFGPDQVAVITGETALEARPGEAAAFQGGSKPIVVISAAGKTGLNLHHITDTGRGDRGRRRVLVVDYEWSSTDFKQGPLGRADRTGQLTAPRIDMLTAGLAGERKFIATIANRMRNMGSLSRGSAEAASNDKLAEFELGGALDTAAMRESFSQLPMEIRRAFLHAGFSRATKTAQGIVRDPVEYPVASLKDWLLDIQFMPIEYGNRAFQAFWQARQSLITRQMELQLEVGAGARTRSHTGEVLRTAELRKDLVLHHVEDDRGHRYGVLQGIITPQMRRLAPYLPRHGERPMRHYVTFNPVVGDQISGLEVGPSRIPDIARAFGASLHKGLHTPALVYQALRAGDVVEARGPAPRLFELTMRPSDRVIQLTGTKPGDAAALEAAGATRVKDQWTVPADNLSGFLETFPQVEPPVNPTQGETPDKATHANLGQEGGILIDLLGAPVKFAVSAFQRSPRSGRPIPTGQVYRAQDPQVEEAITTTRGELGRWWEQLARWREQWGRTFVWEWGLRKYPLEQDEVRIFQAARRHVGEEARRDVIGVVHPLAVKGDDVASRANLELFGRVAVLRDFRSRASDPVRFPGGLPNQVTLAMVEPELKRLEAEAQKHPAVMTALNHYARLMNAEFQDLRARGKLTPDRAIDQYFPHLVLEYLTRFGEGAPGARRMREPFRPYTKPAKGSEKFIETDFMRALYQHRFSVRYDNATEDFQLRVLNRHDQARAVPRAQYRALKPGDRIDVKGVEHETFQLRTGRAIYQAQTVPERIVAQAIAAGAPEITVDMGEVRQRPALGEYFHKYVVPVPIAERFKTWMTKDEESILNFLRTGTQIWKSNVIGFWGVAGNLTNLLGDLVNIGRSDPASWLYLPQATAEVLRWARGHPSALIALLDKYDVLQAGYVGRELALSELGGLQLARYPELRDFLTRRQRILADTKWWVKDLLTQEIPEKREAIPRTALAMSLLERVRRGQTLRRQARGIDIRGLPLRQAAMKIAREVPVDYGKFTPAENKHARSLWFPFYAWTAGNATNWVRWAVAAPLEALVLFGLRMLLDYWNHSTEDKHRTEEGLSEYVRNQPHVNTGIYNEDGKMITVFMPGDPMSDALAIVGGDKLPRRIGEVMRGRISIGRATRDQLWDTVVSPWERMIQLFTPLKVVGALAANYDPFSGRKITPDELKGTVEDVGLKARYLNETLFRPQREFRTMFERAGSKQGIDWLTFRYGAGLPFVRTDPAVGEAMETQRRWEDLRLETVDTVLTELKKSAEYQALPPRQKIEVLREVAKEVGDRFVSEVPPPLTRRFFMEQAGNR